MQSTEKDNFLIKIGEKLKQIRVDRGYSNHETFADEIDMVRSQYWEYENGKKNLTIYTLKKILDRLDISLSDFFSNVR